MEALAALTFFPHPGADEERLREAPLSSPLLTRVRGMADWHASSGPAQLMPKAVAHQLRLL